MALLDDEARHAAMRRTRRGIRESEEGEGVALATIGHEHLRAGDDVVVTRAARHRADRLHVRAGVRLGEAETAAGVGRSEARQKAVPLLIGAELQHDQRSHRVTVEDSGQRHPPAADLFDHPCIGGHVEPEASVLGGHEGAEQSKLAHARDECVRIGVGVLETGGSGPDLFVDEAPD
jgi:hypothetical protein